MLALPAVAHAQQAPATPACQYIQGFKTLHDLASSEIGDCLDKQTFVSTGDALQHSTNGLLVWRKSDNWTAFTNGYMTWINGPDGLVSRLNTDRFSWEHDTAAPAPTTAAVQPAASTTTPAPAAATVATAPVPQDQAPAPIGTAKPIDNPISGLLQAVVVDQPITAVYLVTPSLPAKLGPFTNTVSKITGTCAGPNNRIVCDGSDGSRLIQTKYLDGSMTLDGNTAGGYFDIVIDAHGNQVFGAVDGAYRV